MVIYKWLLLFWGGLDMEQIVIGFLLPMILVFGFNAIFGAIAVSMASKRGLRTVPAFFAGFFWFVFSAILYSNVSKTTKLLRKYIISSVLHFLAAYFAGILLFMLNYGNRKGMSSYGMV